MKNENFDPEQLIELDEINHERDRLRESSNNDLVKIQNVEKVYSNGFKALSDITFGVEKGQIFCFLGPNGAGKSTTFKILTAAEARSSGYVELLGKAIDSGSYHIFDNVGICPQYDPIWNELNPIEHLRIYAMMKGVKKQNIPILIDFFLDALMLRPFAKTKAGGLSGGNKRKLSAAMCLIGAPKL